MRKILKCLTAMLLTVIMILPTATAFGVRYGDVTAVPGGFWALLEAYTSAIGAGDSERITAAGRNLINFWLDGRDAQQMADYWGANVVANGFIINNIWSVSNLAARHYGYLDNREGMVWAYTMAYTFLDAYQELIPHIGGNPADMEFARTRVRNRLASLDTSIAIFAEMQDGSGRTVNFNGLHEPSHGIFFGEQPGNATIVGSARPSAVTIYVEFEIEDMRSRVLHDLGLNERMHGLNREDYSVIQIAWNFLYEGETPRTVPQQEQRVREAARFLNELGLPILLRVGAEMDVWSVPADPEEFIEAFRFISRIMRQEAPNVAMVYSVNFISAFGLDWQMFFPGDDYVDWVGISLYTTRYFMGNPHTDDATAALRRTGDHANPLAFIRQLVDEFGDRFPLLISEGGVSLYNVANSQDLTDWALPVMRHIYSYIPLLFPEVKAIFWFNTHIPAENQAFHFGASPQARQLYTQLVSRPPFLSSGQAYSPVTFARLGDEPVSMPANAVILHTFVPYLNLDYVFVQYRLNGNWLGHSYNAPHRHNFDLSHLAEGDHQLVVYAMNSGRTLHAAQLTLTRDGDYITIR